MVPRMDPQDLTNLKNEVVVSEVVIEEPDHADMAEAAPAKRPYYLN